MKRLLALVFFLLAASFVFAGEVECKGSGNNYSGTFTLGSYCVIPFEKAGLKGKIKVEVSSEGNYNGPNAFHFPVNSYLIIEGDLLSSEIKGEHQLDCSSGFFGWGDTLDLYASDSFPFKQACGDFGKDLVFLTIEKPTKGTKPPFRPYANIAINLSENLIGQYLAGKLKRTVNEITLGVSYKFYVIYPMSKGKLEVIPGTVIRLNLDSIDYEKEVAVFKLTNTKEEEKELCVIQSSFNYTEADFVDCILAEVKIYGTEGNPVEDYQGKIRYYFTLELNPKEKEVVDEKHVECPAGIPKEEMPPECHSSECTENWECTEWSACLNGKQTRTCRDLNECGTTQFKPPETRNCVPSTGLSELQNQINELIEKNYNEIMGVK
jgi:hypothetical protein